MRYDLHVHTKYSPCSSLEPGIILKVLKKKGYDGVAITDHDSMKGSLAVSKLNKDKDFEVIKSSEITTNKGDVLCYYLNEPIKSRELYAVIDEAKSQDALVAVAHPFRNLPWLEFKEPLWKLKGKIDAIEVFNSRMFPLDNYIAQQKAQKLNIPGLGSSDAHFKFDLGNAYTIFQGKLRSAIKKNELKTGGTIKYGLLSGVLAFYQKNFVKK